MLDWFYNNDAIIWWLMLLSGLSLLVTLLVVPVVLVKLPIDYFSFPHRHRVTWSSRHPVLRIPAFLIKNLLGLIFVAAGILMLALPGQGILTIVMGLIVMEFPGKYHAARWLVSRHSVFKAINWVRQKAGKAAFVL
ncbi:MAG: hypothetical protein GY784_14165 [Gammaproteobacteria bacterium]|nr:hypothetical protein [Gammaproteobacteria bacterium]